jgi:hypothetical protein
LFLKRNILLLIIRDMLEQESILLLSIHYKTR